MDLIISGLISGVIKTIISHPFDTMKTWKQNCSIKTPKLTIPNLYRGIKYPFFQNSIVVCTTLSSNEYFKRKIDSVLVSNFISGFITTIFTCPLDVFKITEQQHIKRKFKSSDIIKMYKNLPISLTKKVTGNMIFFVTYEEAKKHKLPYFICGALSGCASWSVTYPIDTIKTRIQSGLYNSINDAIKEKQFYKGFNVCIARAILVNGFGLYVYETILNKFNKIDKLT